MYMRGIVSVLLLIPFLFCSCGRKQPPRQETPEQPAEPEAESEQPAPAEPEAQTEE